MTHTEKRYSNCCYALPLGELDSTPFQNGEIIHTGRCSHCKDGAEFLTEWEFAQEEESSYDEGMGIGGDAYNDTMHGAGDELEHEREND